MNQSMKIVQSCAGQLNFFVSTSFEVIELHMCMSDVVVFTQLELWSFLEAFRASMIITTLV
jgi:hypothetical protein